MDLLNTYNELTNRINELQEEATNQAKLAITAMTNAYFVKHNDLVRAISWVQFTPYFNDGETCYFRVGNINVFMKQDDCSDSDEDDYGEYSEECAYSTYDYDIETLYSRLKKRKEYDENPLEWSRAKVKEQEAIYRRIRYPEDYYITYPPEHETQETIEAKINFAKSVAGKSFFKETEALTAAIASISEDVMQSLFGNHVRVIIKHVDGVTITEIEEYDHE